MNTFMNLKLTQLRLIAAIAETSQLQSAATELAISQPAASRMLAEIEREVGAALFERHPKGMRPTLIGRAMARRAGEVILGMRAMAQEVAQLSHGAGGQVRVGAVTGPALGYLVPAIQQLKATLPDVEVTVEVAPSTPLMRGLAGGRFDFVLARILPEFDRKEFDILPARHEVVALLVREGHPLARAPALHLAELADYEWVIQERGAPVRLAIEDAFGAAAQAGPQRIINTSSLVFMIAILAQTNAIAPMSEEVAQLLTRPPISAGLRVLNLVERIEVQPYFLLRARGRTLSPAAQRLHALVQGEITAPAAAR